MPDCHGFTMLHLLKKNNATPVCKEMPFNLLLVEKTN